jgi:hypothetical protein
MIKDSGERREFSTGAVRDMAEGKGLMVVMPAAALLRLSKHYEHGAKKYGAFNWQKGLPTSSFIDSAMRHIMKYLDGWDDEDHLSAAAFNILGAMEMEAHNPDMQDIPKREGRNAFNYLSSPVNDSVSKASWIEKMQTLNDGTCVWFYECSCCKYLYITDTKRPVVLKECPECKSRMELE